MTDEELHKMVQEGAPSVAEAMKKLAEGIEQFSQSMMVAALFGAWRLGLQQNGLFASRVEETNESFLRDLADFGSDLHLLARRRLSKIEVKRTGGAYKGGA